MLGSLSQNTAEVQTHAPTSLLMAAVLTASFAAPTRLPASQTAPPFARVYPSQTPNLTLPEPKADRSIVRFHQMAMAAKFRGEFVIESTVGIDGRPTDGLIKSSPAGSDEFGSALLPSMSEWTYEPGRLDGVAVPVFNLDVGGLRPRHTPLRVHSRGPLRPTPFARLARATRPRQS
jgi:hypothetical protein